MSTPAKLIKNLLLLVALFSVTGLTTLFGHGSALSGSDFHAGHIIDDVIFTNNYAMSVQAIQDFLNSKVPACDTNGTTSKSYYYNSSTGRINNSADTWVTTSRATYGQRYDTWNNTTKAAAPYVCLKNYVENPTTHANNLQNPGASIDGGQSAAQIIWTAAQTSNINPQVLITTLQKEQGIVTDDWPWTNEYQIAMGYACPDTAPCNTQYFGFANQVNNAAAQFRRYLTNPNNYNYVVGNNTILYNPNTSCGSSVVNNQNQATAALYDYTPYQPNAGALSGVSDSNPGGTANCGAYGNRNFWWYFNTWFGTSLASGYAWQPIQQSTYTDSSMSSAQNPNALLPGQRFYVVVTTHNTGTVTWQKGVSGRQVNIATSRPNDRHSPFCDSSWMGTDCNRPGTTAEASVAPGATGTFGFWATAPKQTGTYNEYYNLVMDGTSWMSNDPGLYWTLQVKQPSWQPTQQAAYTDSSMTTPADPNNLLPRQRYYLVITAKNTGATTWQKGVSNQQVNVGTTRSQDRQSAFCDSSWNSDCNRPGTSSEATVAPGATGTFGFWINTPSQTGTYNEYFNLVMDGTSWMANDPGLYWTLRVNPIHLTWKSTQQSAYTDNNMTTAVDPLALTAGQRFYLVIKAQNTGDITWKKGVTFRQVNVGTSRSLDRHSAFCDSSWMGTDCNRPGTTTEATVAPGATGTFGFWATAPTQKGTYNEYFNLVMDGTTWANNDPGLYWTLKVN